MRFILLNVSSAQEAWSEQSNELYLEKIKHFTKFEIHHLKPAKNSRAQSDQKKLEESEKILQFLSPEDFVIVFDERGEPLDSKQFSKKIEGLMNSGKKRAVFILGGAFGVSDTVRQRAQLQVSLSKMVFNHLVAQVVALEQIYRAFAILNQLPYHNE